MKNLYLIILSIFIVSSCQIEENTQIIDQNIQLNASSPLTTTLKRATQNPTALDNFIDGSSKIRVNFPYQVTINEETNINLDEEIGYENLIEILETTPQQDSIQLNFPINVSTIDYSNQTINSSEEFEFFLENLPESGEINCLELIYPLNIRFFNPISSSIGNLSIENRAQFFNFLSDLDSNGLFFEINYPITAVETNADGDFEIGISSNADFNNVFSSLQDSCFNPLLFDNSPSGNNPTNLEDFVSFATSNSFIVSSLIDEGENIDTYSDLVFNFIEGDTSFTGNIITQQETVGQWSAFLDDGVIVFELDFEDSFYNELDEDWELQNITETDIELIDLDSDGDISTLVFSVVN